MTIPLYCLLFFALWTIGLVIFGLGPYRVGRVISRTAPPSAFPADTPHGPDWYRRLMRAHANCVENLPVFGAVVLTAAVAGVQSPLFDTLAIVYVTARVGQSSTHIASGSNQAINVRFSFFLVQLGCVITMAILAATAAG